MKGPHDGPHGRLGNQLDGGRHAGRQLGSAAIKRREASAPTRGKRKEVSVGHLSIADDLFERRRVGIDGGYVVIPERVSWLPANLSQQVDCLRRCARVRNDTHVARYPHEPRLGHRAGCPAVVVVGREPAKGATVMHMVGPRERHQNVDVQQPDQLSSSAESTISGVMGGEPSRTWKTGKSSSYVIWSGGRSALRTSAEMTVPRLSWRSRARLRTARSTSASRLTVVLMEHHDINAS